MWSVWLVFCDCGFHSVFPLRGLWKLPDGRDGLCEKLGFVLMAGPAATAAKSLQLCLTLCNPIDGSLPGSLVPGILQARTLEWVAISFSNAWKWKVKVKSLSYVRLLATPWTAADQAPPSTGFSRQEYWSGVPLPSPMHRAMLSKSLIQFSVGGRGCVPSLLFDLRPKYGGGDEDKGDLLQKVPCMHCCTKCPRPCIRLPLTHASAGDSWTLTAKPGSIYFGVTTPLSWVLVCTRFCLCPLRICLPSPV